MKKFTILSVVVLTAITAKAQYTCNPDTYFTSDENPSWLKYIVLADAVVNQIQSSGVDVSYIGPDSENGRNLWYWENTFSAGSESNPRVDDEEGGYISVVVGTVGWSGAGLSCDKGLDLSAFDDDTRFHLAYMSPDNNGPESIAIILVDGNTTSPAKFALGSAYPDNGATFPSVGPQITGEWQGIDLSFGDLKKLWSSFSLASNMNGWTGNIFSWLGGGVTGQTMAFDTIYFYGYNDAGVEGIVADNMDFVVTSNTINLNGANGMQLFDLTGKMVKATDGCVLGINTLPKGVYVVKSGSKAKKIVVR